jgi:hypothetical protein
MPLIVFKFRGYVELNPVRAGLEKIPEDWCWSRSTANLKDQDDLLLKQGHCLKW